MRVAGFVDTLPCAAAYHAKFRPTFEPVDDAPGLSDRDVGEDWKSARNLVARIQALVPQGTEIRRALALSLDPGHALPWGCESEAEGWDRFAVAIAVGPGAFLHVGPFSTPLVVGQVLQFNPLTLHTLANFGPVPLVALAVDLRCPPEP